MDTATMMNMLGYRIGDADTNLFTNPFRVKSLNKAQTQMAQLLHPNYLTELEVLDTNNTLTSGSLVITTALTYDVLGGAEGILAVKVYGGKYCKRISMQELKKIENTYYAGSSDNPLYYIFQNRIYVLPTATTAIDIYYLRKPTDLVYPLNADESSAGSSTSQFDGRSADGLSSTPDIYNNAPIYHAQLGAYHIISDYKIDYDFYVTPVSTSAFTDNQEFYFLLNHFDTLTKTNFNGAMSDLNPALHEIIVSFAEAYCWALNANKDRYDIALNNAKMEIEVLNSRYTKAQGIGTSEDKR